MMDALEAFQHLLEVDMEREANFWQLPKEMREELRDEYMYSDPNDFEEIKKLYAFYGLEYKYESWLVAQALFTLAERKTRERLGKKD